MTVGQLAAFLAGYDAWHGKVSIGWNRMDALPVRQRDFELMFANGKIERRHVLSNMECVAMGWEPIAWRPCEVE